MWKKTILQINYKITRVYVLKLKEKLIKFYVEKIPKIINMHILIKIRLKKIILYLERLILECAPSFKKKWWKEKRKQTLYIQKKKIVNNLINKYKLKY